MTNSSVTMESNSPAELHGKHIQPLMRLNAEMFKRNVLTDVECVVEGQIFQTHRMLLICFSPYLERKLIDANGKPLSKKIQIPKIGSNEFEIILRFLYTGNLDVDCSTFLDVYKAASVLEMQDVKLQCLQLLSGKDDIRTYFYSYVLCKALGPEHYWQKALKLITHRFEETVFTKEFMQLKLDYLMDILTAQSIGARSEIMVFLAALNWLNYDFDNREIHAVKVMQCVRFSSMSMEEIVACYHPPFLSQVVEIREVLLMLYQATCYIAAKSQGQDHLFKEFASPKRILTVDCLPTELWQKETEISSAFENQFEEFSQSFEFHDSNEQRNVETGVKRFLNSPSATIVGNTGQEIKHMGERTNGKADMSNFPYPTGNHKSIVPESQVVIDNGSDTPKKGEKLPSLFQHRIYKKVPSEMSPKVPESNAHFTAPEDTKIIHVAKRPNKGFDSKSIYQQGLGSNIREQVESQGTEENYKYDKTCSEKREDKNWEEEEQITLSSVKYSEILEEKPVKDKSVIIDDVNLSPTRIRKVVVANEEESQQRNVPFSKAKLLASSERGSRDEHFILVVGGTDPRNFRKEDGADVLILDFKTNTWDNFTNLPEPRHNHCAQFLDGCLYVIGGCNTEETWKKNRSVAKPSCFKFDLRNSKWSTLPDMKCARYDHGSVIYKGQIFVLGGKEGNNRLLKSVEVYNPTSKRWKLLNSSSSMCCGRAGMGVAVYSNRIWIVGGIVESDTRRGYQVISYVDSYDPEENKWHFNIYLLPEARCYCSLAVWDKKLYCIGGMIETEDKNVGCPTATVLFMDNENRLWKEGPMLPERRMGGVAVNFGNCLYYIGGIVQDSDSDVQNLLRLAPGNASWDVGLPFRFHLFGMSVVSICAK